MAEGRPRRSERISAFDTWKLSELTRASGAAWGRRGRGPSSSSSSSAPLAPVRGRKRGRKKRRLKAVVEVVDCFPSSNRPAGSGSNDEDDGDSDEDDRLRCQEQKEGCRKVEAKHVEKEAQALNQDDDLGGSDQQPRCSSVPWIPDKKTLELILDILQKKDTHEIFAEPVDPEEVEGYYEIIKEPMDFATIRAKLQEGMYAILEQFERDVFLIFSNAMHFNSSSTIYYRQARAIQELAKKTFHRLKADPENFVLDHVTRETKVGDNLKKATRVAGNANSKGQGEPRSSDGSASTNNRQTNSAPDVTNKKPGLSSRRNNQRTFAVCGSSLSSPPADCKRDQDEGVLGCLKDGWRSFSEEERRSTYKSSNPSSCRSDQMLSPLCRGLRELVYVNQRDFGYVESLARFAANLGPTARMVAQRKIERCKLVETANAFASFPAATGVQVSVGNNRDTCTTPTSDPATAKNITVDQTLWGRPGSAVNASVTGLPDSRIAFDSPLSLHSTARPDSRRLLASRSELPSSVSQSQLLEIVSRKSNACVSGNEGVDRDARRLAYCHDKAATRPVLANCSSRTTLAAEPSPRFSSTRNSLWPQSLPPSLSQEFKQAAVIDMSFVQARLSGLSSCPGQQWRETRPLEPLVEMPAPSTDDAWKLAHRPRNQARPPLQPSSDGHLPDLALQL